MSSDRKAILVLRTFQDHGEKARGMLEHEGGSHVCYWHAARDAVPPPGTYQMLLKDDCIALRDSPAEIRPVGHGSGIEIGRVLNVERVSLHGEWMLEYLKGMHRTRDAHGVGTWLEVR